MLNSVQIAIPFSVFTATRTLLPLTSIYPLYTTPNSPVKKNKPCQIETFTIIMLMLPYMPWVVWNIMHDVLAMHTVATAVPVHKGWLCPTTRPDASSNVELLNG